MTIVVTHHWRQVVRIIAKTDSAEAVMWQKFATTVVSDSRSRLTNAMPSLRRSSGVIPLNVPDMSDRRVLTATYCRPAAA